MLPRHSGRLSGNPIRDIPHWLVLYQHGRLKFDELISRRIGPRRDGRTLRRHGGGGESAGSAIVYDT